MRENFCILENQTANSHARQLFTLNKLLRQNEFRVRGLSTSVPECAFVASSSNEYARDHFLLQYHLEYFLITDS